MLLRAFAKINLDLKILGRRPDGYHEVRTILQTIDWFDEIRLEPASEFQFICQDGAPPDSSNLVVRAIREYEKAAGETVSLRIELMKNIPTGAGLGGGSADAAVTLLGLQELYGRKLSAPDLLECLRALGSDVPFFSIGGRATGIGRGDEIVPEPDGSDFWLVLVLPEVRIRTSDAYSWLTVPGESNTIKGFYAQFDPDRGDGMAGNERSECKPDRAQPSRNDFNL